MTLHEITMMTEEPMRVLRKCYERAHLMACDLDDEYFNSGINPDDQGDWWKLAYSFKQANTRNEIILDAMARMRDALAEIEVVMKQINSETPPPRIDHITGGVIRAKTEGECA